MILSAKIGALVFAPLIVVSCASHSMASGTDNDRAACHAYEASLNATADNWQEADGDFTAAAGKADDSKLRDAAEYEALKIGGARLGVPALYDPNDPDHDQHEFTIMNDACTQVGVVVIYPFGPTTTTAD